MNKKRIVVIDDEPLISSLMKEVIEDDQELEVAAMSTHKDEFLNLVFQNSYDVALIDVSLGEREGGLDLLKILKSKGIQMPAIMLSAHDELDYALKCLQSGAKGYVNKNYICSDLIRGLKEVLSGQNFVSGDNGEYILRQFRKTLETASK